MAFADRKRIKSLGDMKDWGPIRDSRPRCKNWHARCVAHLNGKELPEMIPYAPKRKSQQPADTKTYNIVGKQHGVADDASPKQR